MPGSKNLILILPTEPCEPIFREFEVWVTFEYFRDDKITRWLGVKNYLNHPAIPEITYIYQTGIRKSFIITSALSQVRNVLQFKP